MSQKNSEEVAPEKDSEPTFAGLARKASESTVEMMDYFKGHLQDEGHPQLDQDEFDEEEYNNLSSGVYQVEQPEEQGEARLEPAKREYFSQDVKLSAAIDCDVVERGEAKLEEEAAKGEQRYEQVEVDDDKEQRDELEEGIQSEQEGHQQFAYPSLMESSTEEKLNQNGRESSEEKLNQSGRESSEEKLNQSGRESSEEKQQKKQTSNIKSQMEAPREEVGEKVEREDVYQPLIELEQRPSLQEAGEEKTVSGKTSPVHFYRARKCEEMKMEEERAVKEMPEQPTLRIIGYEKEFFLKIQTQVYQVEFVSRQNSYVFGRRFGDFAVLHKMVRQQYPGLILYPFPANTLQFFRKLRLSVSSQKEKVVAIEERLLQLQKFLQFVFHHPQLSSSQILEVFISESSELFSKQFKLLEEILDREEEPYLETNLQHKYNNIKSLVKSGFSFFGSYVSSSGPSSSQNSAALLEITHKAQKMSKDFGQIRLQVEKHVLTCSDFETKVEKLVEIYRSNREFTPIESSIDSVLRLSTKMAASRAYFQQHESWLKDHLLSSIKHYSQLFQQVGDMLQYRASLLERVRRLAEEEAMLASRLVERAEQFDRRFLGDWQQTVDRFSKDYEKMVGSLGEQWRKHCQLMAKIWR